MIDFKNISKSFGTQELLCEVSFRVNPGEHVGITGPNGAGKSTIFKLLTNELSPDDGAIALPKNTRMGHLHQQLDPHRTDAALLEYAENAVGELKDIESCIHDIEARMASSGNSGAAPDDLARLGDLQTRFEHLDRESVV